MSSLSPVSCRAGASVEPVRTQPGHMVGTVPTGLASLTTDPPQARALDGNTVALDQQLTKVADTETTQSLVTTHLEEIHGDVQYGTWPVELAMASDLNQALNVSATGMDAQTTRLRVIAENIANEDTTGSSPGADPYRRKTITFESAVDRAAGVETVQVKNIGVDGSDLPLRYDPANPAANAQGYVKLPNVNSFIEVMDMREAEHSYSANLSVMQATRSMLNKTIDLLK